MMGEVHVDSSARIGVEPRTLQGFVKSQITSEHRLPIFEGDAYIGPFTLLGEGIRLGERVIVDAYCSVGRGVRIGADTLITHRATIGGFAQIGSECVVGGLVGEECVIEDGSRVFGKLIHAQDDPTQSWDHRREAEPSPQVLRGSFVGFDSILIGGVTVGPNAYVAAGAVVSRDVPARYVAYGINQMVPVSQWTGNLRDSPMFKE